MVDKEQSDSALQLFNNGEKLQESIFIVIKMQFAALRLSEDISMCGRVVLNVL